MLLQASDHCPGHIAHPDGLKAAGRPCQRHEGQVRLQVGKQVQEFVVRTEDHAGAQHRQVQACVAQDGLTASLAALVHRRPLCIGTQGTDVHQTVHARMLHGLGNEGWQLHMHLFKALFIAVQHGHQIDHRIVTRHQACQVAGAVHRGLDHGQAWQVLDGGGIHCPACWHGHLPAQPCQLFAHLAADKACAAQHQNASRAHDLLVSAWASHCVASSTQYVPPSGIRSSLKS